MAKAPDRIYIRPRMVDAGRGLQLATIPYRTVVGGRWKVLPPEGDWVTLDSYWTRRINDGEVERVEPPKTQDSKQPAAPAEHGKKDGKD